MKIYDKKIIIFNSNIFIKNKINKKQKIIKFKKLNFIYIK